MKMKEINSVDIFNPFQQIPYQPQGQLTLAVLGSAEKYDPNVWQVNEKELSMKVETYIKLSGEFWYCGLLKDGILLISITEFKQFMDEVKPKVITIKDEVMYFSQNLSKRAANKLLSMSIHVLHIGCEFDDPENDEIYLKMND